MMVRREPMKKEGLIGVGVGRRERAERRLRHASDTTLNREGIRRTETNASASRSVRARYPNCVTKCY